jgi:hypothetical protein
VTKVDKNMDAHSKWKQLSSRRYPNSMGKLF